MLTNKPEHLKSFPYIGFHRYHLTFCAHDRRQTFTSPPPVELVVVQISRAATEQQFAVIAYCFMPDHLHLLIEGQSDRSDCKGFIRKFKQYSGFYYSRQFKETLWQRYGFEHVLRDDEVTAKVARYLIENPVRAGLVSNPLDYLFVGSLVYDLKDLLDGVFTPPS
jgi:putative transposase